MLYEETIKTNREEMAEITERVIQLVHQSGVKEGLCLIFVPHTTAAVTINENADDTVKEDMLLGLRAAFPHNRDFKHQEGNSAAHLKASALGSSVSVIIHQGRLLLGTWQGIYLTEFDGPRTRKYWVKIIEG